VHKASFQIVGRKFGGEVVKQASEHMVNFEDYVELYDSSELIRSKAKTSNLFLVCLIRV